jgi:iron-sulfur cluster assembly accessory protein
VAALAAEQAVPCLVLAGAVRVGRREAGAAGIEATYSLVEAVGVEAALTRPAQELAALAVALRGSGPPAAVSRWKGPEPARVEQDEHPRQPRRPLMTAPETTTPGSETPTGVVLSDPAAEKVKALLAQEGRDDLALRVAVQPGGCSGLRYQLFFDERSLDGDAVQTYADGSVKVVVDRMSVPYLAGATIDFVDTIEKQGFTIDNPNAGGSCACGESFH